MSREAERLYQLLPAVHRIHDARLARESGLARGPLESLITVFAEQIEVMGEALDQLHDDAFIETCADWVVPYIGDLIGYEGLHHAVPGIASPRAEVAHTIAMRRRKGTALVLEQLARDVTGLDARAVEYFQRLIVTQYMNHVRPSCLQSPALRHGGALEWLGTAFEAQCRTVDVRRIDTGRGRHNIPNVGLHLWRIQACSRSRAAVARDGPHRYRASPLNHDLPLYNRPAAEDDITHLAHPDNVPLPLSRRRLARDLQRHYGERAHDDAPLDNAQPALVLWVDGAAVERAAIRVCDLADDGAGWAHTPAPDGLYRIDPLRGRIALPADAPDPADVRLTWHEGFSADIGGGEYERGASFAPPAEAMAVARVPDEHADIASALAAIGGAGLVVITDNGRYPASLSIAIDDDAGIEIRAENGRRPALLLDSFEIRGGANSACVLSGLLISGATLEVPDDGGNALARLDLRDCTLVPGLALTPAGEPLDADEPAMRLALPGLETRIERSIVGRLRSHPRARLSAVDSIIDATAPERIAFAGLDDLGPGAALSLDACTVIGKLHAAEIGLISNCILLALLSDGDAWPVAVRSTRRQVGCVRFSWLPLDSRVPVRHRCLPDSDRPDHPVAPRFTSRRYGTPAYAQLATSTPREVLQGADDEGEMGAFHHLYGPQRETNLRIRLAEYLRVGLSAGIFYES